MFAAVAVVMGVVVFRWISRERPAPRCPRARRAGHRCAAAVLIGPFAGGDYPGSDGAGEFFNRVWIFMGAGMLGGLLGLT